MERVPLPVVSVGNCSRLTTRGSMNRSMRCLYEYEAGYIEEYC